MADILAHNQKVGQGAPAPPGGPIGEPGRLTPRLKYHNQPVVYQGLRFDSQRECTRWIELQSLVRAGAITHLERQVSYELRADRHVIPHPLDVDVIRQRWYGSDLDLDEAYVHDVQALIHEVERLRAATGPVIGEYRADFKYLDRRDGQTYVVDAKGYRTALFRWKAKHFELQNQLVLDLV